MFCYSPGETKETKPTKQKIIKKLMHKIMQENISVSLFVQ